MAGEIVHIELRSGDFARSAAFYGKVFGWRTDGVQSGGHLLFEPPAGIGGSWIRTALTQAPGPVPFVAVDDVEAVLAEVEREGGRVIVRRLALAGRGVFGLFADLDGNVVAVIAERAGAGAGATARSAPATASTMNDEPKSPPKPAKVPPKAAPKKAPAKRAKR
jgi:predicted enzyme related to lactoylglutathione lyase